MQNFTFCRAKNFTCRKANFTNDGFIVIDIGDKSLNYGSGNPPLGEVVTGTVKLHYVQ